MERNLEDPTKSEANNRVITGVNPNTIPNVFFLYNFVTYWPTNRVVKIYDTPITKLLMPKLYPMLFIAY